MPARENTPSASKTLRTILAIILFGLGIRGWYLLAQGIPVGMDIHKGTYTKVTVTDLKNGESAEFTADSDEKASSEGNNYPHWRNASNILHLVRIIPFESGQDIEPQIRFDFLMENGEVKSFLVGDDAVSYGGRTYKIHHWTDSRLFTDLIRSIYLNDESIVIEELVEDDD